MHIGTRFSFALSGIPAAAFLLLACSPAWADCFQWKRSNDSLPGVDGTILATTTWDPDGSGPASPVLVAGGAFGSIGTIATSGIAAWNGTSWSAIGDGLNG